MKAGILYAKGDIRFAQMEEPTLCEGHVKVRVRAAGICGSDIPRVWGDAAHFFPVVLGHEFAGDIVQVSEGTPFAVGDRVAGAPLLPCMTCASCQKGNYALCKSYSFIGSRQQGAFGEFVVLPARNAVLLPPTVTYEMGALFEPCTVALHGLFQAGYEGGHDVLILGGGTIGLLTAQFAGILGARSVTVVDIDAHRLAVAKEVCADFVLNSLDTNFLEQANRITNGQGFGMVLETAGAQATMHLAFSLAAPKAHVCFIGTSPRDLTFPHALFEQMNRKEFHLTGSWMSYSAPFPGREWELTAHYFSTGQLKCTPSMIHQTFPLEQITEAFALFETPGKVKGKVLLINN